MVGRESYKGVAGRAIPLFLTKVMPRYGVLFQPGQFIAYRLKRLTIAATITPAGTADKTLRMNCSIGDTSFVRDSEDCPEQLLRVFRVLTYE
jgi:hypothetical protein